MKCNQSISLLRKLALGGAVLLLAACSANNDNPTGSGGGGGGGGGPIPTVKLTASPTSINNGDQTTLTWTSTNATSCSRVGGDAGWASSSVGTSGTYTATINNSGTYAYAINCKGPGGSAAGTATVMVGGGGSVAAPTVTLSLSPTSVAAGGTSTITWSSTNTSGSNPCTASGAWTGGLAASGNQAVTAPATGGSYDYTLTCTGPGGSGVATATLTVTQGVQPAPAVSIAANPTTVSLNQSTLISWSTQNANSCTGSGGAASDSVNWQSDKTVNGQFQTAPFTTSGVYGYTLTCSNTQSTTSNTAFVTVGTPGKPTVKVTINPTTIDSGSSATISWQSTNATSCTASGSWSGAQALNGSVGSGVLTTPGNYSYTLTCTGPGGSAADTGTLTVNSTVVANDCGLGVPAQAVLAPNATVSFAKTGVCLGCSLENPDSLVDMTPQGAPDLTTFATLQRTIAVATSVTATVKDTTDFANYPAGSTVGFIIANPKQLLTLDALAGVKLETFLGGTMQEEASTKAGSVQLNLLGLLGNGNQQFVYFKTTKPFDSLAIRNASVLGVNAQLDLYTACATTSTIP